MEIYKIIEIEGRRFRITKYDAATAIKLSKLLAAKLLPAFNSITDVLFGDKGKKVDMNNVSDFLNFESISRALDLVSDEDLNKIIDSSLNVCEEELPAGFTKVKNANGSYAVMNLEFDPVLVMRLVVESIMWGISGFFDVSRLTSILKPLSNLFQPKQ
ncbi:phage tail assembly chaperone [uncultured Tissierella sp.]|uniref:phage tail assembly chaperone n=1 Tax=uncultured Tissierella sp. TaxID=448160 RepID=UPI002803E59D|nr:hypothetical protein [uncultured Tissierella sp.]MDU5080229.1 hypothetical protein [Bacillota bacterium]